MDFKAWEVSTADRSESFAAADGQGQIAIVDISSNKVATTFLSNYSPGGSRLAYLPATGKCVTGSYHEHGIGCDRDCGVACFDIGTGNRVWLRRDLRRVQHLLYGPNGESVFCGFDKGPAHELDSSNGKTIRTLRGVRKLWSGQDGTRIETAKRRFTIQSPEGKRTSYRTVSFAVLSTFVSNRMVWVSEAGGPVRCVSVDGGELWRYEPPQGSHILDLSVTSDDRIIGIEWCYTIGGPNIVQLLESSTPTQVDVFDGKYLAILPHQDRVVLPDLSTRIIGR